MDDPENAIDSYQELHDKNIAEVRLNAARIPVGSPGECYQCGEESQRLVNGACAPCRDKYRL